MSRIIEIKDPQLYTKCIKTLQNGGLIIYPTDTCYGIGVDATNSDAIEKVIKLKDRDLTKRITIMSNTINSFDKYVFLNTLASKISSKFLPGPLTLVLNSKNNLPTNLTNNDKIGIRIPDNEFCLELTKKFKKPVTTTSANLSGLNPTYSISEVLDQFKNKLNEIDLIIDAGNLDKSNPPSSVVDISYNKIIFLRNGTITEKDLTSIL